MAKKRTQFKRLLIVLGWVLFGATIPPLIGKYVFPKDDSWIRFVGGCLITVAILGCIILIAMFVQFVINYIKTGEN
jgi:uncharacterized membrane protein YjjP (DUF1212 family)